MGEVLTPELLQKQFEAMVAQDIRNLENPKRGGVAVHPKEYEFLKKIGLIKEHHDLQA